MSLAREILHKTETPKVEIPAVKETYEPSQRMQALVKKETKEFLGSTAFVLKAP